MYKFKKLVLFGTGDLARIAELYFNRDTEYEVVGFTVHKEYLKEKLINHLPVVPFEDVETYWPPEMHDMHVCVVYDNLNRNRARICKEAEDKRYDLASYLSPHAYVGETARLGKHHFIFEANVIQDFVEVGDNAIFWSGNHIGHHSHIGANVFISSHVVVSGHCRVGDNVFIGVNSTLSNGTAIGRESWVTQGSNVSGNISDKSMVRSVQSQVEPMNESALLRALERAKV